MGCTELALKLDKGVNNTSLILAFEFEATGRVALFTADAQVGNWLSWHTLSFTRDGKTFSGQDLIERTVYLKVGHHGSHNATPKGKGLELMNNPDLSAFVPVNEEQAKSVGWGRMPLPDIIAELKKRTSCRITRADDPWIATGQLPPALSTPGGSIAAARCQPGLWVEFDVS